MRPGPKPTRFMLDGVTKSLPQWAEKFNIPLEVLSSRIYVLKWPLHKALATPVRFINLSAFVKKQLVPFKAEPFEDRGVDSWGFRVLGCPHCNKGYKEDGIRKHIALAHKNV